MLNLPGFKVAAMVSPSPTSPTFNYQGYLSKPRVLLINLAGQSLMLGPPRVLPCPRAFFILHLSLLRSLIYIRFWVQLVPRLVWHLVSVVAPFTTQAPVFLKLASVTFLTSVLRGLFVRICTLTCSTTVGDTSSSTPSC